MAKDPKYEALCKKFSEELPILCTRVFALRDKVYSGYGFHWHLERQLGRIINNINDRENRIRYASTKEGISYRIINEVCFEGFIEDLEAAEASIITSEEDNASSVTI